MNGICKPHFGKLSKILGLKMSWCFTPINPSGWLLSKRQKITSVDKDVDKLEPFCTVGRNVKWRSCCGKQFGSSLKMKNRITM